MHVLQSKLVLALHCISLYDILQRLQVLPSTLYGVMHES